MWKNIDKVRAHREALKNAWFNFDHSQTPEVKEIVVTMDKYPARLGYATIKVVCDTTSGYSCFTTLQANPFLYLSDNKEFLSGEYELKIID